ITHLSRQVSLGGFVNITTAGAGLVGTDHAHPAQPLAPGAGAFVRIRDELELVRPQTETTNHIDNADACKTQRAIVHRNANPYHQRLECAGTPRAPRNKPSLWQRKV